MDRKDLESAGAYYYYLRGLLMVPAGVVFALAGMGNLSWGPLRHAWVFVAAVLVAVTVYLALLRYYRENYGQVTPSDRTRTRVAIATVVFVVLVVGGVQSDWSLDLPISGTAIAFALSLPAQYPVGGVRLSRHQMIVFGALLAAGLLPVWGDASPDIKINVSLMLTGAAIAAVGFLDHAALRRAFGPAGELSAEDGNVGV